MILSHNIYLAVAAGAAAEMAIGYFWYSDFAFGPMIRKVTGQKKHALKDMNRKLVLHAIFALLKAAGLFIVISLFNKIQMTSYHVAGINKLFSVFLYDYTKQDNGMINALKAAGFIWFAFLMPVKAMCTVWASENWNKFMIVAGGQFVCTLGMGVAIATLS